MNPDSAVDRIADELIYHYALKAATLSPAEIREKANFWSRDQRLEPWDRKITKLINDIWDEERRIIIANLRKLGKGYTAKAGPDEILYPVNKYTKLLAAEMKKMFPKLLKQEGQIALGALDLHAVFDLDNPRLKTWLDKYCFKFSQRLEDINVEKLRATLTEGLNAGESIPDLMKRVNTTYENWTRWRSEMIARSETIRASNESALEAYRQSGVVEKKIWIVAEDACAACMALGDEGPIDLDAIFCTSPYGEIDCPPLHPNCRCAAAAYFEEE